MARDPLSMNRRLLVSAGLAGLSALLLAGPVRGRFPAHSPRPRTAAGVVAVAHVPVQRSALPEAHTPARKAKTGVRHAKAGASGGRTNPGRSPSLLGGPLVPAGSTPSTPSHPSQATTLSADQSVVDQALGDLVGHVHHLPLGGPTVLPPEPPSHTYLTAETSVRRNGWLVQVYKTDAPYAVDNPAIQRPASDPVAVADFGVIRPARRAPSKGGAAAYLWAESLLATGDSVASAGPLLPSAHGPGETVDLGLGVQGTLLAVSDGTVTLVWHEGDWTLVVRDTTPDTAVAIARPVVAYLHKAYMPPHPGLVAIEIGVDGIGTRVAWIKGPYVYHIENRLRFGDNPTAACAMAVHWQGA